jgi:hypothetical protein
MKIKEGDVYKFRYNEEYLKNRISQYSDPYHCFDGKLVVKKANAGNLYLEDTYWNTDNKKFTLDEALEQGSLKFIVNLEDVEPIQEYNEQYYSYDDLFDLSYQKGCYRKIMKRKGAEKCPQRIKEVLEEKLRSAEYAVESKSREVRDIKEKLEKIEQGNIEFYL